MLLSVMLKRSWDKVRMWREIARQRNQLRRYSEYLAKDIGISRVDAEREADRHFWDCQIEEQALVQLKGNPDKVAADRQNACLQP